MDNSIRPRTLLDSIRQDIDGIDQKLAELLSKRFAASERIRQAKLASGKDGVVMPYRPGREAIVLRQIMEIAGEDVPRQVIYRMWRTILTASTLKQAEVSLIASPEIMDKAASLASLKIFSALLPISKAASVGDAIKELAPDKPVLAAVPAKSEWPRLVRETDTVPAAIVQLVMVTPNRPASAIAILGYATSEATGDDETLVAATGKLPRDFVPKPLWTMKLGEDLHVTSLPGYLGSNEQPLVALKSTPGLALSVVGRYPAPMELEVT